MEEFTLRAATPDDAATIACHRAAMFQDMGLVTPDEYEQLRSATEPWVAEALARKQYVGWLMEDSTSSHCRRRRTAARAIPYSRLLSRRHLGAHHECLHGTRISQTRLGAKAVAAHTVMVRL